MATNVVAKTDYSLVGENATKAVEQGLADASWYTCPVPRDKRQALLVRRDGPAIRDTLIWFGLLFTTGIWGASLWGSWWALIPFAIYRTADGQLYATEGICTHGRTHLSLVFVPVTSLKS